MKAVRSEYEQHAHVQPLKVAHQYRLYPEIIDQTLIDSARVEACLRTTHQVRQPAYNTMSTFYIELSPEVADK